MSSSDPRVQYQDALRATSRASGYYNHNVRVDGPDGPVLVRIPVPQADQMDLRIWPESDVLRVVCALADGVPALRHVSADPPFQVHEFVHGTQLDDLAPRGTAVPPAVIPAVLRLFDQLAAVPRERLPPLPSGWPADGQSSAFARTLSDWTQRVFDSCLPGFAALFRDLGIPDDPLATAVADWPTLTERPFRLLHADLHRRNMLICADGVVFLDWELALWGDPLYELAVHVHKMTYLPAELNDLLAGWAARFDGSWRDDLRAYLRHERMKSAIVHTVRYAKEIAHGTPESRRTLLVEKLTGDLNRTRQVWRRPPLHRDDVGRALARWV
ncbi:MAG TPA: aminoglycoside phosphotransferase family protein [Pseudonocardiaceae bacterium]|jgi:aminoglycoside phosphotransferase (APT) family kinase protein